MCDECYSIQAKLDNAEQENLQLKNKEKTLNEIVKILKGSDSNISKLNVIYQKLINGL